MLWLYLLAAVTLLVIALRRVLLRQQPLNDALYSSRVAIEHVQSGVAWVRADGLVGSINPALLAVVGTRAETIRNAHWHSLFAQHDLEKIDAAYRQALIGGAATLAVLLKRVDGSQARAELQMVTIHDHKTRFVGHYCLVKDQTRELELAAQVQELSSALSAHALSNAVPASARREVIREPQPAMALVPEPEPIIEPVSPIAAGLERPHRSLVW